MARPSRGRHALGAAVTAIPHASVPPAAAPPSWAPRPPEAVERVEPVHAEPVHAEPQYAEPVHVEPESAAPEYAAPGRAEPEYAEPAGVGSSWSQDEWTWPVDVLPADLPDLPVAEHGGALPPNEAEQMPWLAASAQAGGPVPSLAQEPSRISLGFRDGSSAMLEPGSEQAAALEELALLLTSPDES